MSHINKAVNPTAMATAMKQHMRGQDRTIDDLSAFVASRWNADRRAQPIASILLLGPPGSGKSQLVRALSEYLINSQDGLLIFCGIDLIAPTSRSILLGAPSVYRGAECGRLTTPMIDAPHKVILFEEADLIDRNTFDTFVSVMHDGRATDLKSGKQAVFTNAILIFESYLAPDTLADLTELQDHILDPSELSTSILARLETSNYFPSPFLNKLDRITLVPPLAAGSEVETAIAVILDVGSQFGLTIEYVAPEMMHSLLHHSNTNRRVMQDRAWSLLGNLFEAAATSGLKSIRVEIGEDELLRVVSN